MAVIGASLAAVPTALAGGGDTFVVTSTGNGSDRNPGDDACDAGPAPGLQCTLRAAIEEANLDPDADRIEFRIGGPGATGPKVINVPSPALPPIVAPLVIAGYTQPDSRPNTAAQGTNARPRIVLRGPGAVNGGEVGLAAAGVRVVVRGLVIQNFYFGIRSYGPSSVVAGNFVGTNVTGTQARPNYWGVSVDHADHVLVGGTSRADRNLISGNIENQVAFYLADQFRVEGNLIGVDASGTGNLGSSHAGIAVDAGYGSPGAVIGGTTAAAANVIAHSDNDGILMFNTGQNVRILRNAIFANGDLAIDLADDGVSPNDPVPDADADPNGLQNFPVITSARTANGTTRIRGVLRSMPNRSYRLEFFSNPPGTNEARTFIGALRVTTDAVGVVTGLFHPVSKFGLGRAITGTATVQVAGQTS
jgi:CSLREA domain-containing protein